MCYAGLENETSRVESLSREIGKKLLIREKGRIFESQIARKNCSTCIRWSLF